MPSAIDPTHPATGQPVSKAKERANWRAVRNELEHGGFFTQAGSGAVARTVQNRLRETLSAADFGVRLGAADNSAALIAMRDHMRSHPKRNWEVNFQPGVYNYSNNRWLWNLRNVIVNAYGAKFRCTNESGRHVNDHPLRVHDPFTVVGDNPDSSDAARHFGYRFDTALAGEQGVTLTSSGDASNFSEGARVLLYGFDQQFGNYPPNARYFEYHTIRTIDGGVIGFRQPLRYGYDEDWPDYSGAPGTGGHAWGKPRIVNLDRADYVHPELIVIRGAEFLPPDEESDWLNVLQLPGDRVIYEDIVGDLAWAIASRVTIYRRCRFVEAEPDKLNEHVLFEDCEIGHRSYNLSLHSGVGTTTLECVRTKFFNPVRVSPRRATFRDCDFSATTTENFWALLDSYFDFWPIHSWTLEGNRFHYPNAAGVTKPEAAVRPGQRLSLTVGSVSGMDIQITDPEDEGTITYALMEGNVLAKADGGNIGRVTRIHRSGDNLVISGTWPNAPQVGEQYHFFQLESLLDLGGNVVVGNPNLPLILHPTAQFRPRSAEAGPGGMATVHIPNNEIDWRQGERDIRLAGYVRRIWVHVFTPYTGSRQGAELTLAAWNGDDHINMAVIALDEAGTREVTPFGANGAGAGDTLTPANLMTYCHELRIYIDDGTRPLSGTDAEMPRAAISLEVVRDAG